MRVLLLAGGGGTRLWPLSTEERPKQFLPLLSDKSLLAETYERVKPLGKEIFAATVKPLASLVRRELKGLPADRLLIEPFRRNSGPAILGAALRFEEEGDTVTAVVPSDQTVADAEAFRRALGAAERVAESASVCVLGVPPSRPETDFGYIEVKDAGGEGVEVARFIEKPEARQAEDYVRAGHFWNAGIFVFRPSRFLAEARRVAPELLEAVAAYREKVRRGTTTAAVRAWERLPSVSIDYAVMEKAAHVKAVPLRAGWNDAGTWRAVRDLKGASDERGNLVVSDVPVLAPGVRDSAIVVGGDGVLVMPFDREGELRLAVEKLRRDRTGEKGRGRAR
jgi:mannose-1-phosphate guanylyltransferase/mannose-6-phosphate isomerase